MLTSFAIFGSLFGSAIALFAAVLATRASLRTHELAVESAEQQTYQAESEEIMRNLRWGVELVVADQPHSARAGAVVLRALVNTGLGDECDHKFVEEVVRVSSTRELITLGTLQITLTKILHRREAPMPRELVVTRQQVRAAQTIIEMDKKNGVKSEQRIVKIASANVRCRGFNAPPVEDFYEYLALLREARREEREQKIERPLTWWLPWNRRRWLVRL